MAESGTTSQHTFSADEVRPVLGVIASTGKFWNDWYELKSMLSFQLRQVLQQYPEAKMSDEEQRSSLGETYTDLGKRLDEALLSFSEGPPFTLQRLSEILLDAQGICPKLSKLALALEKNLLVTTTLTKCSDPYPPSSKEKHNLLKVRDKAAKQHMDSIENGSEPSIIDKDEIMADVEETTGQDMTIDAEPLVDVAKAPEEVPQRTADPSAS